MYRIPDSKVYGANMGSTWLLSAPDGPHVGPINLAVRGRNHVCRMLYVQRQALTRTDADWFSIGSQREIVREINFREICYQNKKYFFQK